MLLWRERTMRQQMAEAEHGIERRSDLMAHVGEEGRLGTIGDLGRLLGHRKFVSTRLHQRFEVVAVRLKLRRHALLLAHILLDRDVMGDAAIGLHDWRNGRQLVVERAVLALVPELAAPDFAGRHGCPKIKMGGGLRFPGLQDARVFADYFIGRKATHFCEGFVHINNIGLRISHHNAFRALVDGAGKPVQLGLALFKRIRHRIEATPQLFKLPCRLQATDAGIELTIGQFPDSLPQRADGGFNQPINIKPGKECREQRNDQQGDQAPHPVPVNLGQRTLQRRADHDKDFAAGR